MKKRSTGVYVLKERYDESQAKTATYVLWHNEKQHFIVEDRGGGRELACIYLECYQHIETRIVL